MPVSLVYPEEFVFLLTNTTIMANENPKVLIETSMGNITVELYNDTPLHRDNFLKLVGEGFYEGTLFHRVIRNFMIQGGDPDSKGAPAGKSLGTGGPGYTIPAEIVYPTHFHKRGALAAARQADQVNPERASSGSQFYIVWGETYTDGKLAQLEKQLAHQREQEVFNGLVAERRKEIMEMRRNRDQDGLYRLQEELVALTKAAVAEQGPVRLTDAQREVYKTLGGTPHLDGQYTVFGEVVDGLDVVDKIQQTATGAGDRPKENVIVKKMSVIA
jgi:peptidylprolyl isomerase/peptidyl-prolyl cis-trans isomerase B (cyclophilin B)